MDPTPSIATSTRPHVLVADDDDVTRTALAKALRALGLDVEEATDGGRLLVQLADQYRTGRSPEDIDVIVTDLRMPICDGVQILRGLRAASWTTPVILMTGFPSEGVRETVERLGAHLLIKPIDLDAFESLVLACVAERHETGT